MTNETLIKGILNQNAVVYRWIYGNWLNDVKRYIKGNQGNEADAEDIFQEALIVLFSNLSLGKFKDQQPLKNYFMVICRNKWFSHLRANKKQPILNESAEIIEKLEDEDYIEQILFVEKQLNILERCLKKLGEGCQAGIRAFHYKNKSYRNIAKEYNWTEGYAKRKVFRCRKQLRNFIANDKEYQQLMKNK